MQIFVTNKCPKKSAAYLWSSPIRARKMITESFQIIACAQEYFNHKKRVKKINSGPYKITKSMKNHPVVIWVCENEKNLLWLLVHAFSLYLEYHARGGKAFKNIPGNAKIVLDQVRTNFDAISGNGIKFLNFAKSDAKGLDFTSETDVFEAYKKYLKAQE